MAQLIVREYAVYNYPNTIEVPIGTKFVDAFMKRSGEAFVVTVEDEDQAGREMYDVQGFYCENSILPVHTPWGFVATAFCSTHLPLHIFKRKV